MSVRVEVVAMGDDYCAVFRCAGQPDEFLVDTNGRPQRFATASVALRHGRKFLANADVPLLGAPDEDVLGIRAWRAAKEVDLAAEREKVFGPASPASIERNGRTITVCRKRRR